jgi:PRTRC genetic system ThiF family protein
MIHYVHQPFLDPVHPIMITLIGAGGTGSQVLGCLARMSYALQGLGHPGFHVMVMDSDVVTKANLGRQLFARSDVGQNKAAVLTSRINRFFGTGWDSLPEAFDFKLCSSLQKDNGDHKVISRTNLVISCVDSGKARLEIWHGIKAIMSTMARSGEDGLKYWLDFGNMQKTGQVILGTVAEVPQPKSSSQTTSYLPCVPELFPNLHDLDEEDQGPSCSLGEALAKQDLFINSTLANLGTALLWKLFRESRIQQHGLFLNLETLQTHPLPVCPDTWQRFGVTLPKAA